MSIDLDDPIALMLAASQALRAAHLPAVAYGGLVLAMYGEPRETRDADLAVASVTAPGALQALGAIGLHAVISFDDVRFGGNAVSRLSIVGGGQLNTVDLVRPRSPRYAAAMLSRAVTGTLRGVELDIVAPEDFILLKVLSTRERDLEDARSVIATLGDRLDREQIVDEVARLALELPDHPVEPRFVACTQ